jgi:group I intron endonuclease
MGAVFALFAGFYYWTPKIVGRNINDFLGKIHFWTFFVGVNLTFFPQHFLGLAGIYEIISNFILENILISSVIADMLHDTAFSFPLPHWLAHPIKYTNGASGLMVQQCTEYFNVIIETKIFYNNLFIMTSVNGANYYGPYLLPIFLGNPLRIYPPILNRNLIGVENRQRTVIYQWVNLINGKIYVGSAWNGSRRLLSYWTSSVLKRNFPIYNSLIKYGHNNFMLLILEDLGATGSVTKEYMLEREQYYLDIIFSKYNKQKLNNSPSAGSTLGFKHKKNFKLNRYGEWNPLYGKPFSKELINMQIRVNKGKNNPMYGLKKSANTIEKITTKVYVYEYETKNLIGTYSTVECSKTFKIGKDTLSKYLKNGLPYKKNLFSRIKLY